MTDNCIATLSLLDYVTKCIIPSYVSTFRIQVLPLITVRMWYCRCYGVAEYTVNMYYTIAWSSHKVVSCTAVHSNMHDKEACRKTFVSVHYLSNHFNKRLYYPSISKYYRACSALIYIQCTFRLTDVIRNTDICQTSKCP